MRTQKKKKSPYVLEHYFVPNPINPSSPYSGIRVAEPRPVLQPKYTQPKLPASQRRMKIHDHFSPRTQGFMTVPEVRLRGLWLERCGFTAGDQIIVEEEKGVVVIRKV